MTIVTIVCESQEVHHANLVDNGHDNGKKNHKFTSLVHRRGCERPVLLGRRFIRLRLPGGDGKGAIKGRGHD